MLELAAAPRELAVRDREVAVRIGLRLALEELLGALQPSGRERALALGEVLSPEREGGGGCSLRVPAFDEDRVRPLAGADGLGRAARPPGGLGEELEIVRFEIGLSVGRAERLVGLGLRPTDGGGPPGRQGRVERGRFHGRSMVPRG